MTPSRHASRRSLLRLAAAGTLVVALSGCRYSTPSPSGFYDYVALGDSLTAGMQSSGLTAENQRASFPVVLSKLAGSPIHAPEGLAPGCPPPTGTTPHLTSCVRRQPLAVTSNFAVPGAKVRDVLRTTSDSAAGLNRPLYQLILGPGDTQVSAALRARPRFITLWTGANDVLRATLRGRPEQATPPARFERDYEALLQALAPSGANTVLITVPEIDQAPTFIPGPRLAELKLADDSCLGSPNFISHAIVQSSRYPKPLSCQEEYAVTPEEMRLARRTVQAYNASIERLAQRYGHAVFDARTFLRDAPPVAFDPQASEPFGPLFSRDGAHPSDAGQELIARQLAAFINERFGTRIRWQ